MIVKCPACKQEFEAIERTAFKGPPNKLYFYPNHKYGWPLTSSRTKFSTCYKSLMFVEVDEPTGTWGT